MHVAAANVPLQCLRHWVACSTGAGSVAQPRPVRMHAAQCRMGACSTSGSSHSMDIFNGASTSGLVSGGMKAVVHHAHGRTHHTPCSATTSSSTSTYAHGYIGAAAAHTPRSCLAASVRQLTRAHRGRRHAPHIRAAAMPAPGEAVASEKTSGEAAGVAAVAAAASEDADGFPHVSVLLREILQLLEPLDLKVRHTFHPFPTHGSLHKLLQLREVLQLREPLDLKVRQTFHPFPTHGSLHTLLLLRGGGCCSCCSRSI